MKEERINPHSDLYALAYRIAVAHTRSPSLIRWQHIHPSALLQDPNPKASVNHPANIAKAFEAMKVGRRR